MSLKRCVRRAPLTGTRRLLVAFGFAVSLGCAGDDEPAVASDTVTTAESGTLRDTVAVGTDPVTDPEAGVALSSSTGARGSSVTLRGKGFAGADSVLVGFGPPDAEYSVVRTVAGGSALSVTAVVPDWAVPDRDYVWVLATPDNSRRAVSGRFRVTSP